MLLFFIRHGDPVYDPDSLTPLGLRQAEAIGRRLALWGLDEIFASGMKRARQTAEPACELLKMEMTVLDWAREDRAWAQLSAPTADGGRDWFFCAPEDRALLTSAPIRALGMKWHTHPAYAGTDIQNGYLRILNETRGWLELLGYEWDEDRGQYRHTVTGESERRVALFAHHGFGTAFLSSVLDIPYPQVCLKMNICHSGMTVIRFPEEDWGIPQLLTLSNDGHLLADRLPTRYNNEICF